MTDPTIRERLRELLRDAITNATARGRESIFLRPSNARALLDELDTLERRVRAAEGALGDTFGAVAFLRSVVASGERLNAEDIERLDKTMELANRALSEARSLISGTKEPTDG